MKNYKTIKTTKHFDGTYTVEIVSSRWNLIKSIFTGKLNLLLSATDAVTLSSGLFTPKKKPYKKPPVKITVTKVSE
jgi:hypothetical protein